MRRCRVLLDPVVGRPFILARIHFAFLSSKFELSVLLLRYSHGQAAPMRLLGAPKGSHVSGRQMSVRGVTEAPKGDENQVKSVALGPFRSKNRLPRRLSWQNFPREKRGRPRATPPRCICHETIRGRRSSWRMPGNHPREKLFAIEQAKGEGNAAIPFSLGAFSDRRKRHLGDMSSKATTCLRRARPRLRRALLAA